MNAISAAEAVRGRGYNFAVIQRRRAGIYCYELYEHEDTARRIAGDLNARGPHTPYEAVRIETGQGE